MSAKDQLIKNLKALQATVQEVDYQRRGYHVEVLLDNDKVRDFAQVMRRHDFYLVFVGGMHSAPNIEVVYQFASFTLPCRIMGRAPVNGDCAVDTICDIFDGANWHERETKDMFGIVFKGHPYLQPLLLAEEDADLKPLLKSPTTLKPIEKLRCLPPAAPGDATAKPTPDAKPAAAPAETPVVAALPAQSSAAAETTHRPAGMSQLDQTKKEHTFYLNMGPQHPSTHGVLRVLLEMDGEHCLENEPVLGYGHRMQEKMGESRSWAAFLPNTARMDYLSALIYNHGYVGLIERMAGLEVPRRAEFIRVITDELNRVQSHLLWLGAFLLDLGAFTPIMYTFDDREQILDILEDLTGSRLTYSYHRVGGVSRDIDGRFSDATRAFIARLRGRFKMYDDLVTGNIIFIKRVKDVAFFPPDLARRYGLTGPCLRGAGIPYDIRRSEPYSIYPELDFEIPVGTSGDCLDAYLVRVREMEQSLRIIEQCLDLLPEGPFRNKVPRRMKLPQGDCSFSVETSRGELAYHMTSDGTDVPYRLKIRVPSFSNLSVLPEVCRGMLLSDLAMTMGTLDLVIPEIDR